jgi:ABC-type polysaccharide/polyol phosphate export permease
MIKQITLPYCLYINKVIARNFIIFLHNIPILLPIIALFHETAKINLCTLMLIPGLLLIYLNGLTYGLTLAMLGARFRDISQIIKSLIQVVFFVTPVMWSPDILPPAKRFIATLNPFYAFIEFIRDPLIGKVPSLTSWLIVFAVTLLGFFISFKLFSRYRSRIVYWL